MNGRHSSIHTRQAHAHRAAERRADPSKRAMLGLASFGDIGPAPRTCRFPMWPDDAPPAIRTASDYCGIPVQAGKPYCAEHQARCWTRKVPASLKMKGASDGAT